jgi:glucokinase
MNEDGRRATTEDAMATITVGVDLGGTKIQTAAVRDKEVVGSARVPTPTTSAHDVIAAIVSAVGEALDQAGQTPVDLSAVGIGTPGDVDSATGHVSRAANVVGFLEGIDLGPLVSAGLNGVRVVVDNDVRVAVLGEFARGAGRPYRNLLGVCVGTGVGGGLILEGELRRGRGSAGEIGHTVVRPGGRRCGCGREGCLEAYAGRMSIEAAARHEQDRGVHTNLFDIMEHKGKDRVSSSVIAAALHAKDDVVMHLIDQAVEGMAIAVANAQNLLDLEAVIIGGGLGDRLGEPFVDRITKKMVPHLFVPDHPPAMLTTELGDLSGAIGAAVTAGG